MRRVAAGLLLVALFAASGSGTRGEEGEQAVRTLLDSIRDDLVELQLEKALAGIEALIGRPDMTEAERAEALVLRAQTHVAFGDLDAAAIDFGEILRMRPGYSPDPSLTPRKAMERFEQVRAGLVGSLRVNSDPPEASLFVDNATVVPDGDGVVRLLAGEYELRVEHVGFDPGIETILVEPGQELALQPQLIPNARTVILRTDPAGVEVFLDGASVGHTERPGVGLSSAAAELVIENVPLGEHRFEFRKECYRTAEAQDDLTVDLLDRTPRRYDRITLSPSRATLALLGGPSGADVQVDGKSVGGLPLELEVCSGDRRLEVRHGPRIVWSSVERAVEARTTTVDIRPRPNLVRVGTFPGSREVASLVALFNDAGVVDTVAGFDPMSSEAWTRLGLPANTDLALFALPATRSGEHDRWLLYSPILETVAELTPEGMDPRRPSWYGTAWGFTVVDSTIGGAARVATVDPRGPAAAIGLGPADRIVAIGGREVGGANEIRVTLRAASSSVPLELLWITAGGAEKREMLSGRETPLLLPVSGTAERAVVRAAWAVVDSTVSTNGDPAALANLALMLGEFDHPDLAAKTWRRVRWDDRRGIGAGTASYYLGRALERMGLEEEAARAYHAAAESSATTFDDDGPAVAPAARDRLTGLGVD